MFEKKYAKLVTQKMRVNVMVRYQLITMTMMMQDNGIVLTFILKPQIIVLSDFRLYYYYYYYYELRNYELKYFTTSGCQDIFCGQLAYSEMCSSRSHRRVCYLCSPFRPSN